MSRTRQSEKALAMFVENLKDDLAHWLVESGTKNSELAEMLGVVPSAISHALRPNRPISENMIRNLSQAVPRFKSVYAEFYALKYDHRLPPEAQLVGDAARARAERIERLRTAEEEVISAVRALTEAAIDFVKRD